MLVHVGGLATAVAAAVITTAAGFSTGIAAGFAGAAAQMLHGQFEDGQFVELPRVDVAALRHQLGQVVDVGVELVAAAVLDLTVGNSEKSTMALLIH